MKKSFGVKGLAAEVNAVLEEFESAVAEIRGEQQLLGEGGEDAADGEAEEGAQPSAKAPVKATKGNIDLHTYMIYTCQSNLSV